MKCILILAVPLVFGAGCTALSLERHTVNQSQSAADYRYQAALHALAMVAANPGTLPSFALLSSGVTSVSDSGIFNSATTLKGNALDFASEALAFTGTHAPQCQWTVSPLSDYTQLEAMRCACRWVLVGPERSGTDCSHLLADPEEDTCPGPHFGVAERLARLPKGWLHFGPACRVPRCACYQDHCGDTWVWVMPDGMEGLADFTLVLQDIATLNVTPPDGTNPPTITPPLLVTLWIVQNVLPDKQTSPSNGVFSGRGGDTLNPNKYSFNGSFSASGAGPDSGRGSQDLRDYYSPTLVFRLDRVIKPQFRCEVEKRMNEKRLKDQNLAQPVDISWQQWMEWTTPYQGQRASVKPGAEVSKPMTRPSTRRELPPIPAGVVIPPGVVIQAEPRRMTPEELRETPPTK
jgi:hypothetical protein